MQYPPYPLSPRARSVIFALSTVVFLIVAPSVTLYTAGYRLNFSSWSIQKIGVLSIDIEPKDAKVSLNNVPMEQPIPMRISDLVPGTYHLRIEKEGSLPWVKDIVIEENKTTYIKDITLFVVKTPTMIESNDTLTDIFPSHDGNYILEKFGSGDTTKFVLFNTTQELATPISNPLFPPDTIFWSEKNNLIALLARVSSTVDATVLAAESPKNPAHLTISGALQGYQWKENFYSENLLLHINTFLYKLNPKDDAQGAEDVHTTSSVFFRESNNDDWYFDAPTKRLVHMTNDNDTLTLPTDAIQKIVHINSNRAILATDTGLMIVDRTGKQEIKTIATPNFFYDNDLKEYIAWSPWELWTIYDNGTVALLNRMSEKIEQVVALDKTGELLVVTADKLLGFNPGYYVTHEILSGIQVQKTAVDTNARLIYFFGVWNGKKGLYKLQY